MAQYSIFWHARLISPAICKAESKVVNSMVYFLNGSALKVGFGFLFSSDSQGTAQILGQLKFSGNSSDSQGTAQILVFSVDFCAS